MRTTFDELWDHWTWRPIRNCPERFVIPRTDHLISFEILLGYSCFPQTYKSPMAKDPVSVIPLEDGGLISYQQPDGRLIHTLNTPEGFARKLRQLQIPLPTQQRECRLMKISKVVFRQEAFGDQQRRVCSKKSVQQGRSHFCARSVLALREHGKMARTPLAAFFNGPTNTKKQEIRVY